MMKAKQRYFLFLMMLVMMSGFSGCKHLAGMLDSMYEKPKMTYKRMNLQDVSFVGVTTMFEFDLFNPNNVAVNLATMDFRLDIDGNMLLEGRANKGVKVAAKATSPINIDFRVEFQKVAKALMAFFQDKRSVTYTLNVTFGVEVPVLGVVNFPFKQEGQIPIPELPKVSIVKVDMPKLSVFPPSAQLNFQIKLENRAPFPVELRGLAYSIQVSGAQIGSGQSQAQRLDGGGGTLLNIPLDVDLVKVGFAIANAIRSKQFPYRFQGSIDMGMFKVPIDVGGNAKL